MSLDNKGINSHVVEYLDYYCKLKNVPEFAVLLKGKWGAGKTWFIKDYIKKIEEEERKLSKKWLINFFEEEPEEKERKKKWCYISLYGMTSLSQIEDALVLKQLHPVLSSKPVLLVGSLLKTGASIGMRLDFNRDNKDEQVRFSGKDIKLSDFLTDLSNSILIFDDLERCGIEFSNVLGFINNFVEHQGSKVIIVANEDKLFVNEKDKNYSYGSIKEKLIGKTLTIDLDFKRAAETFIKSPKKSRFESFLLGKIELIESIYQIAEYQNLRTLKQVVLDFKRISEFLIKIESLAEKVRFNLESLEVILQLLVVFSIEIKLDAIKTNEITKLIEDHEAALAKHYSKIRQDQYKEPLELSSQKKNEYNQSSKSSIQEDERQKSSLEKLVEKYKDLKLKLNLSLYTPFPSYSWWGSFFDKGILDEEELKKSIKTSVYFPENTPNWKNLWYYDNLNDEEFGTLLEKVELEYSARHFTNIGEVKHIVGLFLVFSDAGLYPKTKGEILKDAKAYIDDLVKNKEVDIATQYPSWLASEIPDYVNTYDDLGFKGRELPEFKDLCTYIDEVDKLVELENMPIAAQELLEIMEKDVWKFHRMVCIPEASSIWDEINGKYAQVPILKHIESSDFVKTLLQMEPEKQRYACYALNDRYQIDEVNKKLIEEVMWLKKVETLLREESEKRQRQRLISGYLIKENLLKRHLSKLISKLDKH